VRAKAASKPEHSRYAAFRSEASCPLTEISAASQYLGLSSSTSRRPVSSRRPDKGRSLFYHLPPGRFGGGPPVKPEPRRAPTSCLSSKRTEQLMERLDRRKRRRRTGVSSGSTSHQRGRCLASSTTATAGGSRSCGAAPGEGARRALLHGQPRVPVRRVAGTANAAGGLGDARAALVCPGEGPMCGGA
jgi:hypothetical protein